MDTNDCALIYLRWFYDGRVWQPSASNLVLTLISKTSDGSSRLAFITAVSMN